MRIALPLAAALAALALTAMAGTATASRGIGFSVGSGELGRVGVSGNVTFRTLEGSTIDSCGVTATISFNGSIPKVAGTTTGRVAAFSFERGCLVFTALTEDLPWTVSYQSFAGALPNIASIGLQLINVRFLYSPERFRICPFTATLTGRATGNPITSLSVVENAINLVRGLLCPISMKLEVALRFEPAVRMTLMS